MERGASVVSGSAPTARPAAAEGWFFAPVVLRDVPRDARCMKEETFGPLVPIATFKSDDDAIATANRMDAGLAAYVFTSDAARGERLVARLTFGHVGLNTATGPTPEAPFGGMGDSGYGREGGIEGILEYTEAQTVPTP
ncbi:MAG: succinate-semialdehyde dehydrogenase/glutarate-semialdehyde dehydrogenase [Polyangiales bacterium]